MPPPKTPEEQARYERWKKDRAAPGSARTEPASAAGQVYDGPTPGSEAFAARRVAQAGVVSDRERTVAMVCHASALTGCAVPLGNIIVPLIVWLAVRKDSPFVDAHGKAAVNFQISVILTVGLLLLLTFVPLLSIGTFPGVIILGLLSVVRVLLVAAGAYRGEDPAYGFGLNLIK